MILQRLRGGAALVATRSARALVVGCRCAAAIGGCVGCSSTLMRAASLARGCCGRAVCSWCQICARSSAKRGSARTASTSRGRPNGMSSISLMRPGRARHHRDAVAEQDRLVDRMGDEHHGLALVRPLHELQQFLLQDFAGLRVERGERLVHQQDRRVDGERAHQADALLHAAGELIGIMLLEAGEADEIEIMRDALLDDGGRRAGHREPEGGVVVDRLPRQQAEMLEHHGDAVGRARRPACRATRSSPALRSVRPAMQRRNVVLPQPLGPTMQRISSRLHRERELPERDHRAVEKQLGRIVGNDDRTVCVSSRSNCFELSAPGRIALHAARIGGGACGGGRPSTRR